MLARAYANKLIMNKTKKSHTHTNTTHSYLYSTQFSPEKTSRSSNRLLKHTSKSARQITKAGDVIELEQGIVIDNENVLITNVTVHVVNPDEEGGILMRLV